MRLPFFGTRRRPTRAWSRLVATGRAAAPPPPPPPAPPHDLIGVVGVSQTQEVSGIALTLLSLERYREGSIALFRLLRSRGRFELEYPHPILDLDVTPSGAVRHSIWSMGGGGAGGPREIEYRLSYAIVPAPASDVSEMGINVLKIEWERWKESGREVVSVDAGPWSFTVSLRHVAGDKTRRDS